ncbi:response regulator transcription factor [Anaerocolumna xylanovorans]|uniref:response regulator transcription factor n=1 Tax=Anaerocolumna xylanovorans TaxID=100134 RepID=UPI00093699B7|nr:response regulator [Anaerocolumna xylanovorans]
MKIFIVDDDQIIRLGLRKTIEKSELNCTIVGEASDGELALEEIKKNEDIDLVITDIRMPVMDGLELIREIRKFNSVVRIIVLSGFDDFKYVRNAFMDGAVDYILKPINKSDFLALLQKLKADIAKDMKDKGIVEEYHNVYQEKIINKLLHGKFKTEEEMAEAAARISLPLTGNFGIMVLRTDNWYKENAEKLPAEGIMEQAFIKITNLFRLDQNNKYYAYIAHDSIAVFIESKANAVEKELYYKYHSFFLNTPPEEGMSFTLGTSRRFSMLAEAGKAFAEAVTAAEARFYLGKGNLIFYDELSLPCKDIAITSEELMKGLADALDLCDYIKVKDETEKIFHELMGADPVEFRLRIKMVLELLLFQVKDFKEAMSLNETEYEYAIQYVNTSEELKNKLLFLFRGAIQSMKQERERRSKKRIEMAKKYIDKHYMESITLNDVAEHVELNPSYFSSLFKKETGFNFTDYLLDTRIEMAKNLLLNPTVKVYEIGCKVGYEDAVSFGRAFKKKIGMSPKEYRKIIS